MVTDNTPQERNVAQGIAKASSIAPPIPRAPRLTGWAKVFGFVREQASYGKYVRKPYHLEGAAGYVE